jgi:hypothetical protein
VVYLFSQTESVWRSYRDLFAEPNREKNDAHCTCPYSPYDSHVTMTWHDDTPVAVDVVTLLTWWLMISGSWTNQIWTRGIFGLMDGCHMAQSRAATWHPGFEFLVI